MKQVSSFDVHVITYEFQEIIGSYIEKIYQLSRDEILIRIKNKKEKESLYIANGSFIALTKKNFVTPDKPTTFAMALRKYLQNGKISEISQHDFDRILKIKISKNNLEYTLIIEFFSKGNIILTDSDDKIIVPLIKQSWAYRKVRGREKYLPPPSQINPFNLSYEKYLENINKSTSDIVRTLAVNLNLSGKIAEEICIKANILKNKEIKNLSEDDNKKIYNSLQDFILRFKENKFNPILVKRDNEIIDIIPFKFKIYNDYNFQKTDFFSRSFDSFIRKENKKVKPISKNNEKIEKLKRQLNRQKETINKFEKEIIQKKIEGDLIYLNYQDIDNLLNEIGKILELKEKNEEIKQINTKKIVKEFDPQKKLLILNLKDTSGKITEVKINFKKTVSENAEKSYDDNKKIRNKKKGAEESLIKTKELIKKAENKAEIEKEKYLEKPVIKEKIHWFEKYRWFISSEGNIVIGGKDAKTNDLVVKKYLKDKDRYAHADIQGAPSIIIKNKGLNDEIIDISEKTLEEACIFAASFSKAWKQFAEAQAYWVKPEQVSKTPQSGEFVPKGAFIIRGKRNYYRCKLEVAVGKIKIEEDEKVMCGPIESIKARSTNYLIIVPGGKKKSDIAKIISKKLDANIDSIDRVLPPGGMQITDSVGIDL